MTRPRDLQVILNNDEWRGPLGTFLDLNAELVDSGEAVDIVATLLAGEPFRGGGGAAAEWELRPAEARS